MFSERLRYHGFLGDGESPGADESAAPVPCFTTAYRVPQLYVLGSLDRLQGGPGWRLDDGPGRWFFDF